MKVHAILTILTAYKSLKSDTKLESSGEGLSKEQKNHTNYSCSPLY